MVLCQSLCAFLKCLCGSKRTRHKLCYHSFRFTGTFHSMLAPIFINDSLHAAVIKRVVCEDDIGVVFTGG